MTWCVTRYSKKCVFAVALAVHASAAFSHAGANYTGVVSIAKVQIGQGADAQKEMARLRSEGYDIAGVNLANGTADIITHNDQESVGLRFTGFKLLSIKAVNTEVTPDQGYKTPDQITTILKSYATGYPGIAALTSIGKSLEGRDIWALKISSNVATHDAAKPAILFNGMHHAREVMSPEVVLDTADYLLTKYGQDAKVTKWVDENEIWLLPMVNPDGNNKVWNGNSMWRKNARGGYGVDINRNYPYAWASCSGSSSSQSADDYHGPSAASEPETQVIMAFVSKIQPVFSISYHSYSELVIYPYGCHGVHSETADIVEPIGHAMAALIPSETGSGTYTAGTPWELLYDVDGGDIDWYYHEQHVLPYVIELTSDSSGFQPPYSRRDPVVQSVRPAWQLLLDKLDQSGIRGQVTDGTDHSVPNATVTVTSMAKGTTPELSWNVKNDGSYHIVLNPGMYTLTFAGKGKTVTKQVTVGADRVHLDVQL